MTDRPILFSGPMVRAILDGRKTQTRRVLSKKNTLFDGGRWPNWISDAAFKWSEAWVDAGPSPAGNPGPYLKLPVVGIGIDPDDPDEQTVHRIYPRVQPVDRLYVREHWRTASAYDDLAPSEMGGEEPVIFEADGAVVTHGWPSPREAGRHRQGMHMPRWASRLTLTVTDVRVQRLQDISEDDAVAEGLLRLKSGRYVISQGDQYAGVCSHRPSQIFGAFWDHLNAKRGFGWDANPWVVAVTFTAQQRNIDQVEA